MIEDARQVPDGAVLNYDLCVVGAGAAGITLVRELNASRLKVLLLETGGSRYDSRAQALNIGEVVDGAHHSPLEMYRHRRLGGTTAIWAGRCIPFGEIDFSGRDYVPDSAWPLRLATLESYYRRAMDHCQAGEFAFTAGLAFPDRPSEMIGGFVSDALQTDHLERFSHPTNFGCFYRRELEASANVTVLTHGTCIALVTNAARSRLDRIHAATLAGNRFAVVADRVVLATGGLEATRLLLAADGAKGADCAKGIGNQSDRLGRYYMCHIDGLLGRLTLSPPNRPLRLGFERTADGIYCRRMFTISPTVQKARRVMNFVARLAHPSIADPSHRDGILSSMFLVKDAIVPEYRRRMTMAEFGDMTTRRRGMRFWGGHFRNMVVDAPRIARFSADWTVHRILAKRKIPYVVLKNREGSYPVDFSAEQEPNPDSRLTLTTQTDAFGMPRLRVDWRSTERDIESIRGNFMIVRDELARGGVATLQLGEDFDERVRASPATGGHHMGTTRMGRTPADGVVDSNCLVFGVSNLYVCSSSVFVTSGCANPTLTIVAFAVRLADHLKQRILSP